MMRNHSTNKSIKFHSNGTEEKTTEKKEEKEEFFFHFVVAAYVLSLSEWFLSSKKYALSFVFILRLKFLIVNERSSITK